MLLGIYNYTMFLSYLNVFIGFLGINMILINNNHYIYATICLLLAGICDMFDGLVSYTKKNRTTFEKKYGIQIDSLADIISFACLPVLINYALFQKQHFFEDAQRHTFNFLSSSSIKIIFCFITGFYVLAALIRLAYFNVNSEKNLENPQKNYYKFIGVPVPISAIIFPSLVLFYKLFNKYKWSALSKDVIVFSYLVIMMFLTFLFLCDKIKIKKINKIFLIIFSLLAFLFIIFLFSLKKKF